MHELSITRSIVDVVLESAREHGDVRVRKVVIQAGALQGIVPESVEFYFEQLTQGTIAQGARIVVEVVPTRVICKECGNEYELGEVDWTCGRCGAARFHIVSGRELAVNTIEVE